MSENRIPANRVEALVQFPVRLDRVRRVATPGVVFDAPPSELPALLASGHVRRTALDPTPFDDWPEPPDTLAVTEVDHRGRPVAAQPRP